MAAHSDPRRRSVPRVIPSLAGALLLLGCGVTGPDDRADERRVVISGAEMAEHVGPTPGVPRPLEGVDLAVSDGLQSYPGSKVLAHAVTGPDGRFELCFRADRLCDGSYLDLGARKPEYHRSSGGIDPWGIRCGGVNPGVEILMMPDELPESNLDFEPITPATPEECANRPPGKICIGLSNGLIWMVETRFVEGRRHGGTYNGHEVAVVIGSEHEFHHVRGTDLGARIPR